MSNSSIDSISSSSSGGSGGASSSGDCRVENGDGGGPSYSKCADNLDRIEASKNDAPPTDAPKCEAPPSQTLTCEATSPEQQVCQNPPPESSQNKAPEQQNQTPDQSQNKTLDQSHNKTPEHESRGIEQQNNLPASEAKQDAPPAPEAKQDTPPVPEAKQDTPPVPEAKQDAPPAPEAKQDTPPVPEAKQDAPPAPKCEAPALETKQDAPPAPEAKQDAPPVLKCEAQEVKQGASPTPKCEAPAPEAKQNAPDQSHNKTLGQQNNLFEQRHQTPEQQNRAPEPTSASTTPTAAHLEIPFLEQGSGNIGFGGGPQGTKQPTSQSLDRYNIGAGPVRVIADKKEILSSTDNPQSTRVAPQGTKQPASQSLDQHNIGAGSVRVIYSALKKFRNTLNRLVWTDSAEKAYQRSKALEKVQSSSHLEVLDKIVKNTPSVSGDLWLQGTEFLGVRKQGGNLVSQTLEQADYLIKLNKAGGIPVEVAITKGNQVLGAAENALTGQRFFGRSSKTVDVKGLHPAFEKELRPYVQIIEGTEGFAHYGPPGAHAEINALNKAFWAADPTGKILTAADFKNFNCVAVWLGKGGPYAMPRCPNCWFLTPFVNYLGPQPLKK